MNWYRVKLHYVCLLHGRSRGFTERSRMDDLQYAARYGELKDYVLIPQDRPTDLQCKGVPRANLRVLSLNQN